MSPSQASTKIHALEALLATNPNHFFDHDWDTLNTTLTCYETRYPKLGKAITELQSQGSLPGNSISRGFVKAILLNVIKSLASNQPYAIAYPASPSTISKAKRKGKQPQVTATLGRIVDKMEASGYLTKISSAPLIHTHKTINGGGHKLNRFLPTQKLATDIIQAFALSDIPLGQNQSIGFVTVTKKQEVNAYTQTKTEIPLTTFTSQADKLTIKNSNNILRPYNQLLSQTKITLAQGKLDHIPTNKVFRKFCRGNLVSGGRLYGGFWQTLPSGKRGEIPSRKDILIDGQPTVELDFKAMHVNMLYAWEGQKPFDGDPLEVQGWNRELVKACLLVALNDPKANNKAVLAKVRQEPTLKSDYPLLLKGGYQRLKDAFLQIHPLLAKHLHADVGVRLQKQDGDIALGVIERMMNLPPFIAPSPIPVLTIHDSFICQAQHAQLLHQSMVGAFEKVMGTKTAPLIEQAC